MNKITEVYLLDAPFNQSQNETILFNSASEQLQYMNTIIKHSFTNFSYQREEQNIRVPGYIENLYDSNYLMYKNENGKRFYCFITKFTYKNDSMTEISFKYDVLQTFMFNYTLKPCFVEREHVNNDAIGSNTIDEGLAIGETKLIDKNVITGLTNFRYIVATTYGTELKDDVIVQKYKGTKRNGIYSSLEMLVFNNAEIETMGNLINEIEAKKEGAIQYIAVVPSFALESSTVDGNIVYGSNEIASKEITVHFAFDSIDGYTPKNNKLFCYPYSSLIISNSNGTENLLKFENFSDRENITFKFFASLGANCIVKMCPKNYKNVSINFEESINIEGYPQCEFTTSNFSNWLSSSFMNAGTNILSTALQVYTGNEWGAIGTGIETVKSASQSLLKSDNVKGNNSTGSISLLAKSDFKFYHQQIKYEYARAIDEYFSRYGYKVNRIKVPIIRGRENFNFVKTQNCNLQGAIPSPYKEEIQEIFNKGITFWHSTSNYGNYAVDNNIV